MGGSCLLLWNSLDAPTLPCLIVGEAHFAVSEMFTP